MCSGWLVPVQSSKGRAVHKAGFSTQLHSLQRCGTGARPLCWLRYTFSAECDLDQRFTLGEVERITGTTRRQLEYWSRLGLVRPRARWGERFFNFADLVAVETLSRLAARRVPPRRLRRALDALEQQLR